MKNKLIFLAAAVALYGCGGQPSQNAIQTETATELTAEAEVKMISGGYTAQRPLETREEQIFDLMTSKIDSVEYTAKSVATQVVSGTNFKYICEAKPQEGTPYLVEMVIYLPLHNSGKETQITSIKRIEE